MTVTQQTLSQGPSQNIVVATTEADSPARTALALLAHVGPQGEPARPGALADAG